LRRKKFVYVVAFFAALWFHNTLALTTCVNVNVFWRHLDADNYNSKDLYGNHDLVLASKAFSSLRHVISSLDALPSPYREFYYLRAEESLKFASNHREDSSPAS
uniref:P4Hc domain-containing protein n=1 Tax=Soboliphyme baturini TaxID=241478 RepID=A0A183J8V4_9BILA